MFNLELQLVTIYVMRSLEKNQPMPIDDLMRTPPQRAMVQDAHFEACPI